MLAWMKHAAASLIGGVAATGAIYALVPAPEQPFAIAGLAIAAYLLGVKMPTPPAASGPAARKPLTLARR